jgi:hypothetical protein
VINVGNLQNGTYSVTGNFVNNTNNLVFISTNPNIHTATISASGGIFNPMGASISTIVPSGYANAVSNLNLSLIAQAGIYNAGSIISAGSLAMTAPVIANVHPASIGSTGSAPVMQALTGNVNMQTTMLLNQGAIAAATGNIILSNLTNNLAINALGGTFNAPSGAINIGTQNLADQLNLQILGGDFLAPVLNISTGSAGVATVQANSITGTVNAVAGDVSLSTTSTSSLTLGNLQVQDPIFESNGDVILTGHRVKPGGHLYAQIMNKHPECQDRIIHKCLSKMIVPYPCWYNPQSVSTELLISITKAGSHHAGTKNFFQVRDNLSTLKLKPALLTSYLLTRTILDETRSRQNLDSLSLAKTEYCKTFQNNPAELAYLGAVTQEIEITWQKRNNRSFEEKRNTTLLEKSYMKAPELGHSKASYRLAELIKTHPFSFAARARLYRVAIATNYPRSMVQLAELESQLQDTSFANLSSENQINGDKIGLLINAAKSNDPAALLKLYRLVHWQRISKELLPKLMEIEALQNIPLAHDCTAITIE